MSGAGERATLLRRGLRLEYLTVGWNIGEGVVAVAAGLVASSPALVGFGIDSAVESTSGAILIWRLRTELTGKVDESALERIERRAERLVGLAFLLLAAYVGIRAVQTIAFREQPAVSPVGIVLTAVSIAVMLWLARSKRRTGEDLRSPALVADARQTLACWYLSSATLLGLALNALLGWWWADPLAAIVIALFLVSEGLEALRGRDD